MIIISSQPCADESRSCYEHETRQENVRIPGRLRISNSVANVHGREHCHTHNTKGGCCTRITCHVGRELVCIQTGTPTRIRNRGSIPQRASTLEHRSVPCRVASFALVCVCVCLHSSQLNTGVTIAGHWHAFVHERSSTHTHTATKAEYVESFPLLTVGTA